MTDVDPKLEAWERGQRRRGFAIAALVSVLALMLLVMAVLAVILVRRSPVIARIDRAEAEDKCRDDLEAKFLTSVGQLIDRRSETPERQAELVERVRTTTAALAVLAEDDNADPCAIELPAPLPEETP